MHRIGVFVTRYTETWPCFQYYLLRKLFGCVIVVALIISIYPHFSRLDDISVSPFMVVYSRWAI